MSKLQRYRLIEERPASLVARAYEAVRSYWSGPLTSNSPELSKFFGYRPVRAGVTVTEATALRYSAFFSAVNLISSQLATLPLVLHKRNQDGGKERFTLQNPLYKLLHDRPNPEMSSFDFRKTVQANALTWGNGHAEIERNQLGRPVALWPLMPGRVTPYRATATSPMQYLVTNDGGGQTLIDQADMLHIHGLSFDGMTGVNMVGHMRESLGLGIAAEEFGSTFFGNGTQMGGVITYPGDPNDIVKKNNREALAARHEGVKNAHRTLALYGGAQYAAIGVSPNLAQFLETRQFQITEVARWFNIPPHKLGDLTRSTNNNIENQEIDFYNTTMMPWFTAWEQELWFKLITPSEQNIQFFQFVVQALLRGDAAARGAFYTAQFNVGAITPNQIAESENRNKMVGGDRAFVPMNMYPLDKIDEIIDANIALVKSKATAPQQQQNVDNLKTALVAKQRELDIVVEERDTARRMTQEAEDAKDAVTAELTTRTADLIREQEAHGATRTAGEAEIARLLAQATSLGRDLCTAQVDLVAATERAAMIDADYQRVCGEKGAIEQARDAAVVRVGELVGQAESFSLDIVSAQEETARANERAVTASHRADVSDAVVTELRGQIVTLAADVEANEADAIEARHATFALGARVDEVQRKLETSELLAAMHEKAGRVLIDQAVVVRTALRDALAYAVECIIRRESDRARKAQASPDKLLKWLENFYPLHGEFCRDALRPIVRAVAATDSGDADAVLDRIVPALIEESTTQLRLVAQDADAESLAPALERVLRRWESERGAAVADRVMRGGFNG